MRTRVGAGRDIHRTYALVLQQFLDAEYVIRIADRHATVQPVGTHDHGYTHRRLSGVGTLGLGDQAALGDSSVLQIVAAHAAFAEAGVGRGASGRNDDGRDTLAKEIERVIEPRTQHRRGMAGVFRCTEHDDGVRRVQLLQ